MWYCCKCDKYCSFIYITISASSEFNVAKRASISFLSNRMIDILTKLWAITFLFDNIVYIDRSKYYDIDTVQLAAKKHAMYLIISVSKKCPLTNFFLQTTARTGSRAVDKN